MIKSAALFGFLHHYFDVGGNTGIKLDFTIIGTKCLDITVQNNLSLVDDKTELVFQLTGNFLAGDRPEQPTALTGFSGHFQHLAF